MQVLLFPFHGCHETDRIHNLPKVAQAIHKREREKKSNEHVRILAQNPHQWAIPACRWNELEKKVSSTSLGTPGWVRVQSKEVGKCMAVYLEGICTKKAAESGKLSIFPVWLLLFHFLVMVGTAFLVLNGISKTSKHFITLMAVEVGETPAGRSRDGSWFSKSACPFFKWAILF